jgi:phage shock protein E
MTMTDKQAKVLIAVIILVSLAVSVYLIGGSGTPNITADSNTNTSLTTNASMNDQTIPREMEGRILLDIRTPQEFSTGHFPEAQNIDFYAADFQTRIDALDRNASYTLYCRSGNRTSHALRMMQAMGFSDVTELGGGVLGWQASGGSLCREC